jgi:adenine-specific DNA methylase
MIPKDCKRLAEVDFPIADVSRHAAREKSIRHGHPSTLHLWWARRPLASSRAVLLGLLWPDPCDPLCPAEFKAEARKRLREVGGCDPGTSDEHLRKALLRFIADFSNWDNAANRTYLDVSRALVKAAHAPAGGGPYEPPLVVDPFAGGGSIPLEALRVGCDAFASDLNPVACLILKVMLEDIPRQGPGLAEELRRVGEGIKKQAERELAELYPKDPDGATPIAYLWARTVRCESPNCGAEIPLVRSFWLCKKASRRRALRYRVERPKDQPPCIEFEVFEPKAERDVPGGTVTRAKAACLCCNTVLPPERVRAQLAAQRGGADVVFDEHGKRTGGARLLAVVTLWDGAAGRQYRVADERDHAPVQKAQRRIAALVDEWERGGKKGLCPVPDEALPPIGTLGFRVQRYGMLQWGDLFTARQKVALARLASAVNRSSSEHAAREIAGLALSRLTDIYNAQGVWETTKTQVRNLFSRQAIAMRWDFAEASASAEQAGDYKTTFDTMIRVVERMNGLTTSGQVQEADAASHTLPDATASIWFTDPPYYDAIPYSDLSDFFYVWLKRALPNHPMIGDSTGPADLLTPKQREAVQDDTKQIDGRPKDREWFEEAMAKAFAEGRRVLQEDGVCSVVFAHKTTEGWEALLSGMIRGGWKIAGSWPIATEMATRMRARDSAALATSVHLICRPRPDDAGVGDWADVLRELPIRVGDWMERLQGEGVRGADLVFACIGPALEIFSRYKKVETADGREVKLDEYLEKVWEVVGRTALGQVLGTAEARARNGAAGAVEEDARLTALFLWTLQATDGASLDAAAQEDQDGDDVEDGDDEEDSGRKAKGLTLVYDVVRRFAQPLGIELPKWEGRVIETKKGVVRLLPVSERARQLFGEDGAQTVASRIEQDAALGLRTQLSLFPDERQPELRVRGRSGRSGRRAAAGSTASGRSTAGTPDDALAAPQEATTLDRVHAAMLLQAGGRTNALRALVKAEQERSPDFLRLANALSALYPKGSEEKRLVDAMLLAVPR